jgi:hypothetical protein
VGRGLSPDPWFHYNTYDHIYICPELLARVHTLDCNICHCIYVYVLKFAYDINKHAGY